MFSNFGRLAARAGLGPGGHISGHAWPVVKSGCLPDGGSDPGVGGIVYVVQEGVAKGARNENSEESIGLDTEEAIN